jgi:hypothetical protein
MKRRLLLSAGLVVLAMAGGFSAGYVRSAMAQHASASPAATDVSAQEMRNMQRHMSQAKVVPLVRHVPATGAVGYDLLRLAQITPPASAQAEVTRLCDTAARSVNAS